MRRGDVLNGYRLTTDLTNTGGGMSQWAFAEKDGGRFFVKLFLAPKFPLDEAPGGAASKARKREVCLAFEQRHLDIAGRLDPTRPGGGNLVVARDFFRVDATYVKVMDRVDAATLPAAHELTPKQILVLLRSLAFSLRMLHAEDIVHGDIKPDNVMVQASGDLFVAKLIDFDEAYVVGRPPTPELIVGDPSYYSPELLRYIKRDERLPEGALTTASDMFSLGLFLHVLLAGDLPAYDRAMVKYPAEALLARLSLDVSGLPAAVRPVVERMLALVPSERPDVQELLDFLDAVDPAALVPARGLPVRPPVGERAAGTPVSPTPGPASSPTPAPVPAARPTPAPAPASTPGLRSTMGRRPRPEAAP